MKTETKIGEGGQRPKDDKEERSFKDVLNQSKKALERIRSKIMKRMPRESFG